MKLIYVTYKKQSLPRGKHTASLLSRPTGYLRNHNKHIDTPCRKKARFVLFKDAVEYQRKAKKAKEV